MNTGSKLVPKSETVRPHDTPRLRRAAVFTALRLLGANDYDLLLPETRHLTQLLREDEIIMGAVYGRYEKMTVPHIGRGLLVITNRRMLLVDKKPLFLQYDDITPSMVSGVQHHMAAIGDNVILNTRMGDVSIRTFNRQCARHFVRAVEDMLCDRDRKLWQSS